MRTFTGLSNRATKCALAPLLAAALLTGCAQDGKDNTGEVFGKIIGAGLGALVGSQLGGGKGKYITGAIGAMAGAWAGGELGKSLDKEDQAYMKRNAQDGLEYGKTGDKSGWKNPDSGNSGTITPKQTYQKADGQYCREFEQTVYVDGKEEAATGRACRHPDGTWKIGG
ncbi:MAG: glycine zipper 2TM domain-containing protein [Rhodospirillaceae bacterium]|nr:glycine zipper 2TM domain-containing protein [Rhodospirillaceae bacterium]